MSQLKQISVDLWCSLHYVDLTDVEITLLPPDHEGNVIEEDEDEDDGDLNHLLPRVSRLEFKVDISGEDRSDFL